MKHNRYFIIGLPGSGKSTLVNQFIGVKKKRLR